jgi:hypothetical protein
VLNLPLGEYEVQSLIDGMNRSENLERLDRLAEWWVGPGDLGRTEVALGPVVDEASVSFP